MKPSPSDKLHSAGGVASSIDVKSLGKSTTLTESEVFSGRRVNMYNLSDAFSSFVTSWNTGNKLMFLRNLQGIVVFMRAMLGIALLECLFRCIN